MHHGDRGIVSELVEADCLVLFAAESDDTAEEVFRNTNTFLSIKKGTGHFLGSLYLSDDRETRLSTLGKLYAHPEQIRFIVCSKDALLLPVSAPEFVRSHIMTLAIGTNHDRKHFLQMLEEGIEQKGVKETLKAKDLIEVVEAAMKQS